MLALIAKNPALGMGYLIGSALGENYWGKRRSKSAEQAANEAYESLYGSMPTQQSGGVDWDKANQILEAYAGNNPVGNTSVVDAMQQQQGWQVPPEQLNTAAPAPVAQDTAAQPAAPAGVPQTPQQANAPAITLENANALGGVQTPQQQIDNMMNNGTYNNGNTGLFNNSPRDLSTVIGAGADTASDLLRKKALEEYLSGNNWKNGALFSGK